jgi:hypothetical protein
VPHAQLISFL